MTSHSTGGIIRHILSGTAFNRYKETFDRAGYAIMLIDNRTNRFIRVNKAAAELFGYTRAELRKLTPLDLSTEPEEVKRKTKEQAEDPIVRSARTKDGKIIIIKVQTSYSDRFHVSLISDVTEEYRIRRTLEINEERLREAQRIGRFG